MNNLPDSIFTHILDIYSGEGTFPGNLSSVSKRCKSLCDSFKKKLLKKTSFVRIEIKAEQNDNPANTYALIAIEDEQSYVTLPSDLLFFLKPMNDMHDPFNFGVDEGWVVEKAVVTIVTASKILKEEIDFDFDAHSGGRFEKYNYEPEDALRGQTEYWGIENYAITIEPQSDLDDNDYNVLHFSKWNSYLGGFADLADTDVLSVRRFVRNWDLIIPISEF